MMLLNLEQVSLPGAGVNSALSISNSKGIYGGVTIDGAHVHVSTQSLLTPFCSITSAAPACP